MISVYIHIPFCKNICSYCDFCKMYYESDIADKYLKELKQEIDKNYNGEKVKSLYIGGGTPSCLNNNQLTELFSLTKIFDLSNDYEYTIEANINDITEDFLKICYNSGVNRLSIGIETVNEKFFKFLNRYNDKKIVREKINLAKQFFNNINVDLMYGFYKQTLSDLKMDLDYIYSLDIQHISIYSLIIEKHTKLFIDNVKKINEELESKMYYYVIKYLKDLGYIHYEISNFSKDGYSSIHNLCYWNNDNYYGFGLGASGYTNSVRYKNTKSITNYLKGNYVLEKEKIDEQTKMEEEMICGLRKIKGVSVKDFYKKYNKNIKDVFNIDKLIEQKMLVEKNGYIFIPENKLYVSNSILINFIL